MYPIKGIESLYKIRTLTAEAKPVSHKGNWKYKVFLLVDTPATDKYPIKGIERVDTAIAYRIFVNGVSHKGNWKLSNGLLTNCLELFAVSHKGNWKFPKIIFHF